MKKLLSLGFLSAILLTLFVYNTNAQSTLIHYWNFNTLAGPYIHPNIPHIMPDYPSGDTGYLEYYILPGTSATWAISGPDSNNAGGAQIDNVAGDTTNARNGAVAGTGIRFRNPTDSAEIRWHIPSTGFSNLVVTFATETSSEASGDSVQDYSYSIDGGKTWDSTGMTVNGAPGNSLDLTQGGNANTIYASFQRVTVTFGSATTVNNNPNLIFRIVFNGHTHPGFPVTGGVAVSGNNRFDNVTVDGVPMPQGSTLIHYWNFNTLAGPYIHPNIPHIMPDYPSGDTGYLEYYILPGTSATWAISGPDSNNAGGAQIDNVAGDTTNARQGAVAGTGIRFRNPTDSAEIRWHIPSTGFSNLVVTFATETSSEASGDSVQNYSYSVDGGKTWDSTGMTVNGASAHTLDLTQGGNANTIYASFQRVTVTFGSATTVNNNPNLIFRIVFNGHTHPGFPVTGGVAVSGNNRFDNVTVDGVGKVGPPPPPPAVITMITPAPSGGNIFVPGRQTLISFHASSTVGRVRTIKFSTDSGKTYPTTLGTVTDPGDSTYTWTIPNTATTTGFVNVTDSAGVTAKAGPFIIYPVSAANLLVHYWNFNSLGIYKNPNIPAIPSDFSANESNPGSIQYVLEQGVSKTYGSGNGSDQIDPVAGSEVNAQLGSPAGNAMRVRNPTDSMELRFAIPTTGYKGITISYALQASSFSGPQKEFFSYSPDGGSTWIASGLMVDGVATDSLSLLDSAEYQAGFGLVTIGFNSSAVQVDNNSNFVFRIKFGDTATGGTSGNNRFDNLTVTAASATAGVDEPVPVQQQLVLTPNPATDYISFQNPFTSPVNVLGQEVQRLNAISSMNVQVNTSGLSAGSYYIHVQDVNSGNEQVAKFIKQ